MPATQRRCDQRKSRRDRASRVLGHNFRNRYELALDSFGNIWQTDNDDDGNAWTRVELRDARAATSVTGVRVTRSWSRGQAGISGLPLRASRRGPEHRCVTGLDRPAVLVVYGERCCRSRYRGHLLHAEAGKRLLAHYPVVTDWRGLLDAHRRGGRLCTSSIEKYSDCEVRPLRTKGTACCAASRSSRLGVAGAARRGPRPSASLSRVRPAAVRRACPSGRPAGRESSCRRRARPAMRPARVRRSAEAPEGSP